MSAGIRVDRTGHRQLGSGGGKKSSNKHAKKQHSNNMKTSRSSPSHLGGPNEDDRDPESYQTVSIQVG